MLYYKVIHFFVTKQPDHVHCFDIGIYDSKEKAKHAVEELRTKDGFCQRPTKFYIMRTWRFCKPKWLNQTYWKDGFDRYTYTK